MMMGKPKRGLFGNVMLPGTPGIGDGIEERKQMDMGAPGMGMAPEEAPRPGLFGQGGVGRAIAGTIGDTLLQYNGMAPVYAPTMQAQQEAAARQRETSMKREQGREDWLFEQQWKRDNPTPTSNDTVADYEFIRQNLGEAAAKTYLQNRADPPQYRQGADGQFYRVQTGGAAPPTAPVGKLTPITGGPTPQASGGFREAFAGF